jgi:2-isopropylmalate synthase
MEDQVISEIRESLKSIRQPPAFREDKWCVSPHNFPALSPPRPNQPVTVTDITSRLLEQMEGIGVSPDEVAALITALSDMGVHEAMPVTFISNPWMREQFRAVKERDLPIKLVVMPFTEADVDTAVELGADVAELQLIGAPGLYAAYRRERVPSVQAMLDRNADMIRRVKSAGITVRATINDCGYASREFVQRAAEMFVAEGADAILLADSGASLAPRSLGEMVAQVASIAPDAAIGVHLHDDFGLALALALAAYENGATQFDTTVHAVGEKAGQLDLGQILVALEVFYQVDTGVDLSGLYELSLFVQDLTRIPIPPFTPLVGEAAFSTSVEELLGPIVEVDPYIMKPISPPLVGNRTRLMLGRTTRERALALRAAEVGYELSDEEAVAALEELHDWYLVHKRGITDSELRRVLDRARRNVGAPV